jgi:hypothetical protein
MEDSDFEDLVDVYVDSTVEWVESYLSRSFDGTYPAGLEQLIIELVCNIIQGQVLRQDTPIIDEDNTRTRQLVVQVVTPDIKARLRPYFKRTIGLFGIGTQTQYDTIMDTLDESDIDDVE